VRVRISNARPFCSQTSSCKCFWKLPRGNFFMRSFSCDIYSSDDWFKNPRHACSMTSASHRANNPILLFVRKITRHSSRKRSFHSSAKHCQYSHKQLFHRLHEGRLVLTYGTAQNCLKPAHHCTALEISVTPIDL
jgi:hypothetical protein